MAANDQGAFHQDVLHRGLPNTGMESHHFCRALETAMFEMDLWKRTFRRGAGAWLDFWSEPQGLYLGLHARRRQDFAFKVEKHPKEAPNAPRHCYPAGTARWLRATALHVPRLAPGERWDSDPVVIRPHRGDWHAGADRYSHFRHEGLRLAPTPSWMAGFAGWTEILGKTYLGERFHDYRQCADEVVRDAKVTGLNFVFYYGHTRLGAEGADFDNGPAPDLGGARGFRSSARITALAA